MRDFLLRHSYVIVWVSGLTIIGAAAVLIIQLNDIIPDLPSKNNLPTKFTPGALSAPTAPITPAEPSVSFSIQKGKKHNSFFVQWANLPAGTTGLRIFRTQTGKNAWTLWKTISLSPDQLSNGNANLDIGQSTENGYSFRVEAVGGGGGGNNSSSTSPGEILWTSTSTIPVVTTSTPNENPPTPPAPTSTAPTSSVPSSPAPSSSNPTASSTPVVVTPSGTPYYNPQIQISAYGPDQSAHFWVLHVDQKVQINWQNLPAETTSLIITRAQNQSGTWSTVLTEQNPGIDGPYSVQLVDNTFGVPFYYQMKALAGSNVIAQYGPVLVDQ
jgi:hypothetical protein